MSETTHTTRKRWLTEGIILALIPIAGYALCFAYQAGYAAFFHIPLELIEITIPQILIAIAWLAGIVFFTLLFFNAVYECLSARTKQHFIFKRIRNYSFMFVMLFVFFCLFPLQWKQWIGFVICIPLLLFMEFVPPLLLEKGKLTYKEKLKSYWQWSSESSRKSLIAEIHDKYGADTIGFVMGFAMLLSFSYSAGEAVATHKAYYMVDHSKTNTVVVAIYNNKYVEAPFDPVAGKVSPDFTVCFITDKEFRFQVLKVGPFTTPALRRDGWLPEWLHP